MKVIIKVDGGMVTEAFAEGLNVDIKVFDFDTVDSFLDYPEKELEYEQAIKNLKRLDI